MYMLAIYNPITDSQIKDGRQTQPRRTRELLNKTVQSVSSLLLTFMGHL